MRTPQQWWDEFRRRSNRGESFKLIEAIQSDASRSAARSERERAARVCDETADDAYDFVSANIAYLIADRIRALPDADSSAGEASGKAEGER